MSRIPGLVWNAGTARKVTGAGGAPAATVQDAFDVAPGINRYAS